MKSLSFSFKTMDFDTYILAYGGGALFALIAISTLYSTIRTNRRYGALGAKPPAVVSSDLIGIWF